jgi:hypothetical protein
MAEGNRQCSGSTRTKLLTENTKKAEAPHVPPTVAVPVQLLIADMEMETSEWKLNWKGNTVRTI